MTPFLSQLLLVPFNFAPRGWALCNGALLPISQNQALFSLLGTTYGGNGVQTFGLPDLRGRAALAQGQGPGLQNYDIGTVNGVETVTLTVSQLPNHQHTLNGTTASADTAAPTGTLLATPGVSLYTGTQTAGAMLNASAIGNNGGNQAHANQSPLLVLNWIIALQGIYPSRS